MKKNKKRTGNTTMLVLVDRKVVGPTESVCIKIHQKRCKTRRRQHALSV